MGMHSFTFRMSDEDRRHLDAIVEEMQASTSVDLTRSDVLRMLLRGEGRRRRAYGPHQLRDVICERNANGQAVVTGVRHDWVLNSVSGFEWGYAGVGPSDLALNILLHATGDRAFAGRHYLRFRDEVVSAIPLARGKLRAADVLEWVARCRDDERARAALSRREGAGT